MLYLIALWSLVKQVPVNCIRVICVWSVWQQGIRVDVFSSQYSMLVALLLVIMTSGVMFWQAALAAVAYQTRKAGVVQPRAVLARTSSKSELVADEVERTPDVRSADQP